MITLPQINIERLKNREGKSNTEIACLLLGWQGGTIQQVSQETGLSLIQILESDNIELDMLNQKLIQLEKSKYDYSLSENQKIQIFLECENLKLKIFETKYK